MLLAFYCPIVSSETWFSNIFTKLIEFRIELEKDKMLEDYKTSELIRLKADMIADLIVEFSKKSRCQ